MRKKKLVLKHLKISFYAINLLKKSSNRAIFDLSLLFYDQKLFQPWKTQKQIAI